MINKKRKLQLTCFLEKKFLIEIVYQTNKNEFFLKESNIHKIQN